MKRTVGERLKIARGDIRQSELAAACGVETATISMWETNRNHPTVANLIQMADYLGVRIDWLLREIEPMRTGDGLNVAALTLVLSAVADYLRKERKEFSPSLVAHVSSALYQEMTTRPEADWRAYLRGMIEMAERK